MPTYILLDPFKFPYNFYHIRGELIYVLSIVVCIPSTFCPTLGHHQGRIYYKSYIYIYIMFNEICINEEMLPKYTYIYIYIYIYKHTHTHIYIIYYTHTLEYVYLRCSYLSHI